MEVAGGLCDRGHSQADQSPGFPGLQDSEKQKQRQMFWANRLLTAL
jgi:hypothetical protein